MFTGLSSCIHLFTLHRVLLIQRLQIYSPLERALDEHATHPCLEPTYNPAVLARAPALAADISYLLQVPESDWQSHPVHVKLMASPPAGLSAYVSRIVQLSRADADPTPLLAHAYVRYLGDLSGGQTIRHTMAKAYELDESVGLGLSFYAFRSLTSSRPANQGEMKRIKEWFREGINFAGEFSTDVKGDYLFRVSKTRLSLCLTVSLFRLD